MARPRKIKHSAVALAGASFSLKCGIFRLFFLGSGHGRGKIGVKRLCLGCWPASDAYCINLDHAHIVTHAEGQHITSNDKSRAFLRNLAVYPDAARLNAGSRQGSCLEEPRMPKPFIEP